MWKFSHTETTDASPEELWARYAQPTTWPLWDRETEWVTMDGPFAVGTTGVVKPVGSPRAKFTFVEVTEGRSFTDVTWLPLARMQFAHLLESTSEGGTRFTHTVTISGPLASFFGRVIGRRIAAGLPHAMQRLAVA